LIEAVASIPSYCSLQHQF